MRIYLACNVEKVPEKTRKKMSAHVDLLEAVGHFVFNPYEGKGDNEFEIRRADEIHLFFSDDDAILSNEALALAINLDKPIRIMSRDRPVAREGSIIPEKRKGIS